MQAQVPVSDLPQHLVPAEDLPQNIVPADDLPPSAAQSVSQRAKQNLAGTMGAEQIPQTQALGVGRRFTRTLGGAWQAIKNSIPEPELGGGHAFAGQAGPMGGAQGLISAAVSPITAPAGALTESGLRAVGVSPEVSQVGGDVAEQAAPLALPGLVKGPAGWASNRMKAAAQRGYRSALKPVIAGSESETIAQSAENARNAVNYGLEKGRRINRAGLEQQASRIDELNNLSKEIVGDSSEQTIPPDLPLQRVDTLKTKFKKQVNPTEDLSTVAGSRNDFKRQFMPPEEATVPGEKYVPGEIDPNASPEAIQTTPEDFPTVEPAKVKPRNMTPLEAQEMKQGTYRRLHDRAYSGEEKSASIQAQKRMASGLKDVLADHFPELKPVNEELSSEFNLRKFMEKRVETFENQAPSLLQHIGSASAGAAAGFASGSPLAGLGAALSTEAASYLARLMMTPGFKSGLAIRIWKGSKGVVPLAEATARVEAYGNALARATTQSSGNTPQSRGEAPQ